MEVKDAIRAAKTYVATVYADESVTNIGLEEIEFDDTTDTWSITIGFSRPWNTVRSAQTVLLESFGTKPAVRRSFKVVHVDSSGKIVSMSHRKLADLE